MSRIALATLFVCAHAAAQPAVAPRPMVPPAPSREMQPGYGVVEEVTAVKLREASAAAGGSSSDSAAEARPAWRLKVRMPDGSVQYRDLDRREFRPGDHVLLTNAGDVLPD